MRRKSANWPPTIPRDSKISKKGNEVALCGILTGNSDAAATARKAVGVDGD